MGSGRWDSTAYNGFASSTHAFNAHVETISSKTVDEVYAKRALIKSLDPKGVAVREARDSVDNPESTPIIVALDVTGSMGMIADTIAREGLGILFTEILSRKPVTDPHIMFMGIGDAKYDTAPLQVSQFETTAVIIDQLTDLYLEHGGGGNSYENYNFAWYFAGMHTSTDCYEKRGKKGYLFTVGDEEAPAALLREEIVQFIGDSPERDLSNEELLEIVGRMYHVFHVIIEQGNHGRHPRTRPSWTAVLGQRAIPLSDYTKLSQVIVSAIEVTEKGDAENVAKSWGGDTAVVVRKATEGLTKYEPGAASGVVTL